MRDSAIGQRGGLVLRARLPQVTQQPGHGARIIKGDVRDGAIGQRGGLFLSAYPR